MEASTVHSSMTPECNTTYNNASLNTNHRKRKHASDLSSKSSVTWSQGDLMVEDISVPTEIVGLLIGKAGAAHKRLQMISGARIYIAPDPPSNVKAVQQERLVTITGELDAVRQAKSFIHEAENTGIIPFQLDPDFIHGHVCEDLLIPKDKVGLLIGKKGEKIKRLQEETGCKMFIYMDGIHKHALEKTLRITGLIDKVSYGKVLVEELLINSDMERKEKMLVVSARLAKRLIGKKGASVKMIQKQSNVYMHIIEDPEHCSDYRTFRLNGTDLMIQKAVAIMQDLTKDYSISVKDPPNDWSIWADNQVKQLRQKQELKQQEQETQQQQKHPQQLKKLSNPLHQNFENQQPELQLEKKHQEERDIS